MEEHVNGTIRNTMKTFKVLVIAVSLATAFAAYADESKIQVRGPIAATAQSHPFGAADHTMAPQDLRKLGYVEEEYFFSGAANVYDWPNEGPVVVRTPDVPYTTRVVIRRPADPKRFSGTAVVELLNPSNRFDLNIGWGISHEEWVRKGDAWVGITAKPIAVVALKAFDPQRYASLSFANPLPLDAPKNCTEVAADSARTTENGLVWDIHRQVAQWLRGSDASNPFRAGNRNAVERLYAWGYSQSGSFLYTYINTLHPLDVKTYGKSLFDAYFIGVSSGPVPIHQCSARPEGDDPRRKISNVGVPVVRVMTQSDYLRGIAARRPDSDEQQDRYRNYEIAGSGHATPDELLYGPAVEDIKKAGVAPPAMDCNEGPRSRFPNSVAFNAVYRNLDAWVRSGIAPPRAEPIRVEDGKPVLDSFGNVTGGIRSPFVDVPTAQWSGTSTGPSFCMIAGHEKPFDAASQKKLYPSQADYARAVRKNVDALIAARFITPEDGAKLISDAAKARIPQ
jgi:Alpha/beta hydrolase domain